MASPAGPPPISNPSEDDSTRILAATWTVTSVALVTVITRLYVRFIVIRNWGWDDALMTFAMSMTVAGTAVIAASIHYGAGKHLGDIPLQDLGMGLKLNFISQPIFLISICVVKLAVGASLLRIASTKFYKYLILSIMGFMTFYTVGCFFTLMFQCTDLRVLWDPTVHATCWSQRTLQALSYTNAALNILTDLLFAIIIPTPMLWSLNVHRRTRLTLLFILGLGVFACAASLVKVSYVVNYGKQGDWLWDSRDISIWTVVEDCTGIVAGSLPTLKPLFKRFLGSTYGKGSRKTPGGGYIQNTPKTNKSNWESLSSARRHARDPADETSSERALNTDGDAKGLDQYEMGVHPGGQGNNWTARTTVVANRDAESSDESLNRLGLAMGITKTTTTTVKSTFK